MKHVINYKTGESCIAYKFTDLSDAVQVDVVHNYMRGWECTHEDELMSYEDAWECCLDCNEEIMYTKVGEISEYPYMTKGKSDGK